MKNLHCLAILTTLLCAAASAVAEPVKMVFNNTDVATVLRAIGTQTGVTIVYTNKEKAPVTLNIAADSVEQAVKIVAATAGLSFKKAGMAYVVAPPESMRRALEPFCYKVTFTLDPGAAPRLIAPLQETFPYATVRAIGDKIIFVGLPEDVTEARTYLETMRSREEGSKAVTDVVMLTSACPTTVAKIVEAMYPGVKATPTGDDKAVGGAMGLSGPRTDLTSARNLAQNLDINDSPQGPNPLVTQVYNLRYTSAFQAQAFLSKVCPEVDVFIAPESFTPTRAKFDPISAALTAGRSGGFSSLANTGQQQQENQSVAEKQNRSKMLVLKGRRSAVGQASDLLQSVDLKPKQIRVEVNVLEVPINDKSEVGINWNWSPLDFQEIKPGTPVTGNPGGDAWDNYVTRPFGSGLWSRVPMNFRGIVDAMVTKGTAKVLARPSVTVIDNDAASVFIGDTYRVSVSTSGSLGTQNVQIEEFPVGIILLMSPRLNVDGNITMKVNPVVSSVTDLVNGLPQTGTREAETSVIVKDGETIVLGGLINDEERRTVSEIPLLSKLPLVGLLFQHQTKTHNRKEIVVSLTPHIIPDKDEVTEKN